MIESVVEDNDAGMALLRVNRVSSKKQQLKEGKGINFPDGAFATCFALGIRHKNTAFICENADLIGYSFVRDAGDVKLLQDKLFSIQKRPAITKIETPDAVKIYRLCYYRACRVSVCGNDCTRGPCRRNRL